MLGNSGWLIAEHLLRFVSAVVIGLWMARHLGPASFGRLSILLTAITLFSLLARAGIDTILIRELVAAPNQERETLRTARRAIGIGSAASLLLLGIAAVIRDAAAAEVVIVLLVLAIQPLCVNESLLQARLAVPRVVISRLISSATVAGLRVALILNDAPVLLFAVTGFLEQLIGYLLMVLFVRQLPPASATAIAETTPAQDVRRRDILMLFGKSWPTLISAVAIFVQTRVDQLLIFQIAGPAEAGIYTAAVKFYEAWIVVPYFISTAFLPGLVAGAMNSSEQVETRLVLLYRLLIGASLAVAIVTTGLARVIVSLTLGRAYEGAAGVLSISIFAGIFSAMGSVNARYFVASGLQRKLANRTLIAAALGIGLNLLVISRYGITGCAWVTLFTTFVCNYALDYTDPELKQLRSIKHRALFGRLSSP